MVIKEKFGVELISLAIQSLEPADPEIADALASRKKHAYEKNRDLNQQARVAAAKAKRQADEEIEEMEHTLELKKIEMKKSCSKISPGPPTD